MAVLFSAVTLTVGKNQVEAINEAKTLQLEDDPSDVEVQAVHQKLLQSLAQNDPFWPRWIYFAEQHGVTL